MSSLPPQSLGLIFNHLGLFCQGKRQDAGQGCVALQSGECLPEERLDLFATEAELPQDAQHVKR